LNLNYHFLLSLFIQLKMICENLSTSSLVFTHVEPNYEHLDFIWARDVHEKIYPKIVDLLATYATK
jgi:hypothetical protein